MTTDAGTGEPSAHDKRRMLAELLKRKSAEPRDAPLSLGQERLYRLARMTPDEPFYNVAVAYRLAGPLDPAAVERAVLRLADRHEVLRATFPEAGGRPVQRIAPPGGAGAVFHLIDLGAAGAARLDAALRSEVARVFDLAAGPLWRVALIRLGAEEHVLVLTMHHIVTDGWSFELLLGELSRLVAAFGRGEDDPLPPAGQQYTQYAERQRALLAEPDAGTQRRAWAARLDGAIPALRLPADRDPGVEGEARAAASHPVAFGPDLGRALADLSRREGASLFMTTLAAFAAVLARASGQQDLLVCTPVTGRHRAQSREVVGYCNNILPIRIDLSGDPTLAELLRRVRAVTLEAYKTQDVPFQETADLPALRRIPLNRLLFSLDMAWPPAFAIDGLACTPVPVETGVADFDFSVSLWTLGDALHGNLRHKTALFGPERVAEIEAAYRAVLDALTRAPETRLSDLPAPPFAAPATAAEAAAGPATPPRFALEERLAQEWREAFGLAAVGIDQDFRALGASSLAVALLAERIRTRFGVEVDIPTLFRAGSIERMAELLTSEDGALARDPLAPIQPRGTKPPFFLCEGFSVYYGLATALGDDHPVYGLVRRDVADMPNVVELATYYREHVRRVQPHGPYHLGGLSFGGMVAFELARQLRAEGEEVALLALFDTPGPGAYRPKRGAARLLGHARNVLRFGLPYLTKRLGGRLRRLLPAKPRPEPAAGGEAAAMLSDVSALRNLFRRSALVDYRVEPYDGRITLFVLRERDGMSDSLFDPALGEIDPLLGWGSVAGGGVEVFGIEGDHVGLLRPPGVETVASHLRQRLR